MTIGEKIAQLRKEKGYSQEDLALRLHLSRQAISKYELNQAEPDIDTIKQLATLFQVSTDELLSQEPVTSTKDEDRKEKEETREHEETNKSFLDKVIVKKTQYSYIVIFICSILFLCFLGLQLFQINYTDTTTMITYYGRGNFYDWLTRHNVWLTDTRFVFGYIFYLLVFLASISGLVLPFVFLYFEKKGKDFYKPVFIVTIVEAVLCFINLIIFDFYYNGSLYTGGVGGYFLFLLALAQTLCFFFVHRHLKKKEKKTEKKV